MDFNRARSVASLGHTFEMRDYCFIRKDNNGVIYELCQSSPEYLTSVGYTLQSAEDSPHPPALTMGVDGGTPPINWRDVN